jgi:hypothetical protein
MGYTHTTSLAVTGLPTPQIVAVDDDDRREMIFYAKKGNAYLSFGNGNHDETSIEVTEGSFFGTEITVLDKVTYTITTSGIWCTYEGFNVTYLEEYLYYESQVGGSTGEIIVITDRQAEVCLAYNKLILTYNNEPLAYNLNRRGYYNLPPVFKTNRR